MNDQFLQAILAELGPTGLLILGLYWLIGKNLDKMQKSITTINHNSTAIKNMLEKYLEQETKK